MKEVAEVAEKQLLHRLFFTSSLCISETFAVKVVQNAIAGMVQRYQ